MAARLTVIFYIVLCLEAGVFLTVLPWWQPFGMIGDWGDNFLLAYASQKIGLQGLQQAVASGWVRGAVTGLGLLNLVMAFWEMTHFREAVRRLEGLDRRPALVPDEATTPASDATATSAPDAVHTANADHLSRHPRRDDARDHPGE
ncbi:MAG: hypothetical protein LC802_19500 [Acidobacteria bacterium]|nr:hypothetical protein [Acidobacteriota bacterium]